MTRYLGCFYVILTIAGGIFITDLHIKLPFLAACGAMQLIVFIMGRREAIRIGAIDALSQAERRLSGRSRRGVNARRQGPDQRADDATPG